MVMKREPVQSSAIQSIGYDEEKAILEVRFNGGGNYNYVDVSPEMHTRFMASDSKGRFFNEKIKHQYESK